MQPALERFLKALRAAEVPVSVRETLEAYQVSGLVGFDDRRRLKDALAVTVAKSADEKDRFDACFDLFFDREAAEAPALPTALDDADGAELEIEAPEIVELLNQGDIEAIAAAMEAAANRAGVAEIRYTTQRGILARRMLDEMGLRQLEQMIWGLRRQGRPAGLAQAQALEAGRTYLLEEARRFVDRQIRLYAVPNSERLREEFLEEARLSSLEVRDLGRMQRIVRRMAKRLAEKHTRRLRRVKRGRLDIARTIRHSMGHDGIPFELYWRQRRIDKPKVVAICDVSRSVSQAARFLLLFLYSLNEVLAEVRAFAFSDRLAEVSQTLDEETAEEAITQVLDRIGFRPTDYGRMLEDFEADFLDDVDRKTTVIILGDGRSNNTDPRTDLLEAIYRRAKRVIWLNPEPRPFWGSGDSEMPRYVPYCHIAKVCNTVKHLERVIDDLLIAAARGA
jgi:uncharacterized protein with von Willebrand factor type A (vWA) domain